MAAFVLAVLLLVLAVDAAAWGILALTGSGRVPSLDHAWPALPS